MTSKSRTMSNDFCLAAATVLMACAGGFILSISVEGYRYVPDWFHRFGPWLFVCWYLSWAFNPERNLSHLLAIIADMAFPVSFSMVREGIEDKIGAIAHLWACGSAVIGSLYILGSIYAYWGVRRDAEEARAAAQANAHEGRSA